MTDQTPQDPTDQNVPEEFTPQVLHAFIFQAEDPERIVKSFQTLEKAFQTGLLSDHLLSQQAGGATYARVATAILSHVNISRNRTNWHVGQTPCSGLRAVTAYLKAERTASVGGKAPLVLGLLGGDKCHELSLSGKKTRQMVANENIDVTRLRLAAIQAAYRAGAAELSAPKNVCYIIDHMMAPHLAQMNGPAEKREYACPVMTEEWGVVSELLSPYLKKKKISLRFSDVLDEESKSRKRMAEKFSTYESLERIVPESINYHDRPIVEAIKDGLELSSPEPVYDPTRKLDAVSRKLAAMLPTAKK